MELQGDFIDEVARISDCPFFIYDDLGSQKTNDWRSDITFALIDIKYESKKPTVITTNLDEAKILETYGPRLHSRLFSSENTVLDFGTIDWRKFDPEKNDTDKGILQEKPLADSSSN